MSKSENNVTRAGTARPSRAEPTLLAEFPGKVFSTVRDNQVWYLGDQHQGIEFGSVPRYLDEVMVSFNCVLPELSGKPGIYNLLSLTRGIPGLKPRTWNPVRLRQQRGGVYLYITYEPARSRIAARMNVGHHSSELVGVTFKGVSPELISGRVLLFYVEINEERLFVSIQDQSPSSDLRFDDLAPSTGGVLQPWGASPEGHWFGQIGVGADRDRRSMGFPSGFGVSDLRIALGSEHQYPANPLAYSGALDFLIFNQPEPEPVDPGTPSPAPVHSLLGQHARMLRILAEEIEEIGARWPVDCELSSTVIPHTNWQR